MLAVLAARRARPDRGIPALAARSASSGQLVQAALAVVVIGGLFFAGKGGGIMGVVESIESFSHIASYIRIMAVGLAGAIFAERDQRDGRSRWARSSALIVGLLLHSLNFAARGVQPEHPCSASQLPGVLREVLRGWQAGVQAVPENRR